MVADDAGGTVVGAGVAGAGASTGAEVPGAEVPGAEVPGAYVPGTVLPGTVACGALRMTVTSIAAAGAVVVAAPGAGTLVSETTTSSPTRSAMKVTSCTESVNCTSTWAAAARVPRALLQQLAPNGRLILPLGAASQQLVLIERRAEGFVETRLEAVRFVPLLSGVE